MLTKLNFSKKQLQIFFWGFVSLYFCLFLFNNDLGAIDDHAFLKPYDIKEYFWSNRLYPMNGVDVQLMKLFVGLNANVFYFWNGIQFLLGSWLFYLLAKKFDYKYLLLWPMVTLGAGYTTSYFRLMVPERSLFLLYFIILTILLSDLSKNFKIKCLILSIAAQLSFYFKEPSFLCLGSISFLNFFFVKRDQVFKKINLILFLNCLTYPPIYLYLVYYVNKFNGQSYGHQDISPIILYAKNIVNYVFTDGWFLFPCLIALVGILKRTIKDKNFILSEDEALLAGPIVYFLVLLVLKIYQEYYLLPSLVFFLPYFFLNLSKWAKTIKYLIVIFSLNSILIGLNQLSFYKTYPSNFQKSIQHLISQIRNKPGITIGLLEIDMNINHEILNSFKIYSHYNQISPVTETTKINVFDILIETPFVSTTPIVTSNFNLVLDLEDKTIPSFSIKALQKKILIKFLPEMAKKSGLAQSSQIQKTSQFKIYKRGN
jgi:hypothetical protein